MNTQKIQEALTEVCKNILHNTENHSAPEDAWIVAREVVKAVRMKLAA